MINGRDIRTVFREMGLGYLRRPVIDYPPLLRADAAMMEALDYYRDNIEEFSSLRQRYGEDVRSGRTAPALIAPGGGGTGLGLFAAAGIPEGGLIGEYTGIVRPAREIAPDEVDEEGHFPDDWSWEYPADIPGWPPLEIDAARSGNGLRFVNHSMDPNLRPDHFLLGAEWVIVFIAARDIAKGEEFTIDYGDDYWSGGFRELVILVPEEESV